MTPSFRIARVLGIDVRLHVTFIAMVALLLGWAVVPGSGARVVPLLALLSLFGLAALHEMGHALVARRLGVEVEDILFLPILLMVRLRLPERTGTELAIAAAGPAVNLLLAVLMLAVSPMFGVPASALATWTPESLLALIFWINLLMGTVNLLPAFPMDGGRMLRALLATRHDYASATRLAVRVSFIVVLVAGTATVLATQSIAVVFAAVFLIFLGRREERDVAERARRRRVARLRAELEAADSAEAMPADRAMVTRYGDFRRLEDPRFRERFEQYRRRIEDIRGDS